MDVVAQLQKQFVDLIASLYREGFLDDQFLQLQKLQDDSNPDFVFEVVSLFFEDSEKLINNLATALQQPVVDLTRLMPMFTSSREAVPDIALPSLLPNMLTQNSIFLVCSIGAQRVKNACVSFRNFCEEKNLDGFFAVFAILDPVDFLALQAVRKSLDDLPGSNYFGSWDFTSDPCGFAGVFCDGDKVVALNLGDPRAGSPGLTGRIDPAIGKLSGLAEFSVVPGRITGALPEILSELQNLRFLGISRNFLSGGIPAGLGKLRGCRRWISVTINSPGVFLRPSERCRRCPTLFSVITVYPVQFPGSIPKL
nr:LRR receptor-like serine/threonine-protein kinase ERL1 [Ipomoea batatas]